MQRSDRAVRFRDAIEKHGDHALPHRTPDAFAMTGWASALVRLPRAAGVGLIRRYRLVLSPWIGGECRYLPTCSSYAEGAITRYGLWAGSWMGIARVQRCGPLGASGFDPVPEALPAN